MTRTNWYPSTIKPARKGWYEIKWPSGNVRMRYWNGMEWVFHPRGQLSMFDFLGTMGYWRGLTEPYYKG